MSTHPQPRIFLSPPHLGGNEQRYVNEAFASNYIAPLGPMVDAFEREFAEYTGIPHCVALTSGTAAIHLALRGLGVGAGDTVIASSLTFIGSVTPILFQNATPIFIDADAGSWNMDMALLAETLADLHSKNALPKAVLPTDLYGQSSDMHALRRLCDNYGVALVIDAAESVGAHDGDLHAGALADAAAFSFNGNKIITTSGGGMLASHNKKLIEEARFLSQQARDPAPHYEHTTYGYNYRMSNILAAIGRGQLEMLDARVARRREIFARYATALGHLPGLRFMPESPNGRANRWLSVMLVDAAQFGCDRETIRLALEAENIESRPMWKPMHLQPVFKGAAMIGGAVSEALFRDGLCLPSGSALSDAQVERVCNAVKACARR
ncbi:MAG: DegT/DnrJ/EryC1/StrS family aminotransferase [Alphaproteobacteria bacterium]|nr:DegT/DnrJ/EryC1/StrS family aminotransferase [Alphaproteobacteria bacterium]